MTLLDRRLAALGVAHGFGLRSAAEPPGLVRPRQVHGHAVARPGADGTARPADADAIASAEPGLPVGVVTADCVPILAAAGEGRAVVAIHAGWRGLASEVVSAGIEALRSLADGPVVAAIGPHIGPCCYEIDEPVVDALRRCVIVSNEIDAALTPTRPGHWRLDLGRIAAAQLQEAGLEPGAIGRIERACTACDAARFHSFRRDGEASGRLVHHIAAGVRREG